MRRDDDDDELPSRSSREVFDRADKGESKRKERILGKDAKQGGIDKTLRDLKLDVLKQEVEEGKEKQGKQPESRAFKTKTHHEQEQASRLEARTQPDAERLTEQGHLGEAARETLKQEKQIQADEQG